MSLWTVSRGSVIWRPSRLFRFKVLDLRAADKNLAADPQDSKSSLLDKPSDSLPGNAANAGGFRLRNPVAPVLKIG